MTPSWYDVLGVEPDAEESEIRAAWRAGIAELDPTDRRFRALSQAAEVLLDPDRRAAHDAALAAEAEAEAASDGPAPDSDEDADEAVVVPAPVAPKAEPAPSRRSLKKQRASSAAPAVEALEPAEPAPARERRVVPTWALLVAGALAIALSVTAAIIGFSGSSSSVVDDADAEQAEQAAVRAVAPVLSYDYRNLDEDSAAARTYMTASYQKQYDQTFAVVKENAPGLKAVVSAEVVDAGIVRTGPDRVEVLVFVNRPTSNKRTTAPVVFKDQVTVTMVRDGDSWLIDDLATS